MSDSDHNNNLFTYDSWGGSSKMDLIGPGKW